MDKSYEYRVFLQGTYLGNITDVVSDFVLSQELNSAGSVVDLEIARLGDDIGKFLNISTGLLAPGAVISDDSNGGTLAWNNPSNARVSDGLYADYTWEYEVITEYLNASDFGFNIPSEAQITGITVEVEGLTGSEKEINLKIVKGGTPGSVTKNINLNDVEQYYSVGGSTDLWGETFTSSDINASDFGVVISTFTGSISNNSEIDFVGIRVHYQLLATPEIPIEENYNVDVFVYFGQFDQWVDHEGNNIVTDTGDNLIFATGSPNGRRIFSGYISRFIARYGTDNILVTLTGHGSELDNYMIEGEGSTTVVGEETTSNATIDILSSSSDRFAQSFLATIASVNVVTGYFTVTTPPGDKQGAVELNVSIYDDDTGEPGTLLGSTTGWVSTPGITQSFDVTFIFPESIPTTITDTYWCVYAVVQSFPIVTASLNYNTAGTYAGGSMSISNNSGSTWTNFVGRDIRFSVQGTAFETVVTYNSTDPSDIVRGIMDIYQATGGRLSYSSTSIVDTTTSVSYTFRVNTILEGIQKSLELAPYDWYWYVDQGTNLINFKPLPSSPNHIFTLGEEIQSLNLEKNIENLVNLIYFTGGEIGSPGVPLFKRYADADSINTYRRGLLRVVDQRITDPDSMDIIAEGLITRASQPQYKTDLTINAALYNIESISLGDVVGFRNFDNFIDNLELQIVGYTKTPDYITLQLDTLRPKVSKRVEDIKRNLTQLEVQDNPDSPS